MSISKQGQNADGSPKGFEQEDLFFRFCVFHHIQTKVRNGTSQEKLGRYAGVSQSTYHRWLSPKDSSIPYMKQLFKLCNGLNISFQKVLEETEEIISENSVAYWNEFKAKTDAWSDSLSYSSYSDYLADAAYTLTSVEGYDSSADHLERLSMFSQKKYIALYMHQSSDESIKINEIHISTQEVDKRGFCPFCLSINDSETIKHTGKIVSPPGDYYTYFYFSGRDPIERGMWILYSSTAMEGGYHCGTGVLLSINRTWRSPSFQRIILLEENSYVDEIKNFLYDELRDALPIHHIMIKEGEIEKAIPQLSLFDFKDLVRKHKRLYDMIMNSTK